MVTRCNRLNGKFTGYQKQNKQLEDSRHFFLRMANCMRCNAINKMQVYKPTNYWCTPLSHHWIDHPMCLHEKSSEQGVRSDPKRRAARGGWVN